MEFEDASVDVAAGTVNLDDDFYAKKLEVSVAAGEFTNDSADYSGESSSLPSAQEMLICENLNVQDLEADCGIGNIDLDINGKEADYDYEISCAAGAVDIGDSSYSGIGHEKKISESGCIRKDGLDCGVGNITVDFE